MFPSDERLGEVFVFTIPGCPHCRAAKNHLENDLHLSYHDITVDENPDIKKELFLLSGSHTLPQIFFNDQFIGGNSDLEELLENPTELNKKLDILTKPISEENAKFQSLIYQDASLEKSGEELMESISESGDSEYYDLVMRMQHPDTGVSISDRMYHLKTYKKCFVGKSAVDWLTKDQNISRQEAVELGNILMKKYYFRHVCSHHRFKDKYLFYRFFSQESSKALNKSENFDGMSSPKSSMKLSHQLRIQIISLYDRFLSEDGKSVNYQGLKASPEFEEYVKLSNELQRSDIIRLNENQRKAFFINVYNTLVIHAYVQQGIPKSFWGRFQFFSTSSYLIGGQIYSLDDIEHRVLRGNKPGPFGVTRPFQSTDPRFGAILTLDPRIHFALVCGAKGCPPIRAYTPEQIDDQLNDAAVSFLESGCIIEGNSIQLSKILQWYRADFGSSTHEVLSFICQFLLGSKKEKLEELLASGSYRISYMHYNWTPNSM